jgi:hypothetical protein
MNIPASLPRPHPSLTELSVDFEFCIQRRLVVRSREISYDACFGISTAIERILTVLAVFMYLRVTSLITYIALETAICLNSPTQFYRKQET